MMILNKANRATMPGEATAQPLDKRSSVADIIDRIDKATAESPIAVFYRPRKGHGHNLVAIFGNTVNTLMLVDTDPSYIGSFNRHMDPTYVKTLLQAVNEKGLDSMGDPMV